MILRKWKDGWSLENIAAHHKCSVDDVIKYLQSRRKEWMNI